MSKVIDIIQYIMVIAAAYMGLFISWKAGLLLLIIDGIVGIGRNRLREVRDDE